MITPTLCLTRLYLTLTIISIMQILISASTIDANLTRATGEDQLLHLPEGSSNRPLNLSVSVELAADTDRNLSGSVYGPVSEQANKRIKLVIRWLHPTGKPPEGYNVEVRATNGNNSHSLPRCSEHFSDYFKHVEVSEATWLEIGGGTKMTKVDDHFVQFGCSYAVSIQSTPLESARTKLTTTITVPDCVEGVCPCSNRAHLPAPQSVTYNRIWSTTLRDVEDRSYELNWSYEQPSNKMNDSDNNNNQDDDLASFISVRVEKAENVLALGSIYRQVREYHHPVERSVGQIKTQHFRQVIHHLEARSNFRVRIAAHDAHFCEGQIADLFFNREPQPVSDKPTDYQKETMIGVAVVGSLFVVATAITVRLSWKSFLRRLHLIASETTESQNHNLHARYSRPPSHSFYREARRSTLQTNGQQQRQHHNLVYHHQADSEESRSQLLASGKPIDDYEIDPSQLKLGAEIGKGAFGRVHLATAENLPGKPGTTHLVAVKQIKKKVDVDERDDFLAEISMMKRVGIHPNIVVMLACITVQQPLSMVLEYVPYGDLLHYLRTLRTVYHQSKGLVAEGQQQLLHQRGSVAEGPRTELSSNQVASTASSTAALLQPSSSNMSSSKTSIKQLVRNSSSDSGSGSRSYHLSHIFSTAPVSAAAPAASSTNSSSTTHSSASYVFPNYYKGFLNHFPTSRTIDAEELHDFARQIARGMEHLERKGITHRDLAARNLLLSEGRILKISDFGLSRHGVYVNTKKRMLPLRWLAVESMTDNLYSSKSDVWAFGVVLWEICTLGGFPYADVCDAQLMTHLLSGNRLTRPDNVSEKLYEMMIKCWNGQPDDRPTFQQLRASLEESETHREAYVDFGCYTNVGGNQSAYQLVNLPPTEEDIVAAADTTR